MYLVSILALCFRKRAAELWIAVILLKTRLVRYFRLKIFIIVPPFFTIIGFESVPDKKNHRKMEFPEWKGYLYSS